MLLKSLNEFFGPFASMDFTMRGIIEDERAFDLYREHAHPEAVRLLEESDSPVFVVDGINAVTIAQSLPAKAEEDDDEIKGFILINAKWVRLATEGNWFQRWACKRVLSMEIAKHELTHAHQYERGDLSLSDNGQAFWKGRGYKTWQVAIFYPFLPWEREAHERGWEAEGRNVPINRLKLYSGFVGTVVSLPLIIPTVLLVGMLIFMPSFIKNLVTRP